MADTTIIERQAVRAILLTSNKEVLLLRIRLPDTGEPFWIAPGGGIEAGETPEAGLRRELKEELGLTDFALGPLAWQRRHTFTWAGRRFCQYEQYHIVVVDRFDPMMTDEVEAKNLDCFRWWQVEELAHARERLTPLSLATIIEQYITYGPPRQPLAVEVLVD